MRKTYAYCLIHIFLISLFCYPLAAEGNYSISGNLSDKATQKPLPGATVYLEKTPYGAIADRNGHYKLKNIPAGHYNMLVAILGYKTISKEIELNADINGLNFELEERPLQTGQIVVSANKRIQAVQDVPISISVIDSRSILQRNAMSLDKALAFVPGVEVNKDNVSIRGSSGFGFGVGSRVALLLDGFPMLAGDNGDMKFDAMPMFGIERLEIVKGAGSALYGSSALGGVINIISQEPGQQASYKFRSYAGVYTKPRYKAWDYSSSLHTNAGVEAGYSKKFGSLGAMVSGTYNNDQSWRQFDDSKRISLYSKLNYDFSDKTTAMLAVSFADEDKADWIYWNSLDSATFPAKGNNNFRRINSRKLALMSQVKQIFSDNYFIVAKAGYFGTSYSNNLLFTDPERRQSDANTYTGEVQGNWSINEETLVTTGLFYQHNGVTAITYGNRNQDIFAAYVQGEFKYIENLIITAGGRIDYDKAEGINGRRDFSPKLGLAYKVSDQLSFRASTGSGFRAPTVAERYATASFQGLKVKENTLLLPETSWSYEIGGLYEGQLAGLPIYLDMALFWNDMSDMIEPAFLQNEPGTIQFMNVTKARIRGIEAGFKTLLFGFAGVETSITMMDPKDLTLNQTLKYRSEFLWYNKLTLPFGPIEFQFDYRYKSKQKNIDASLEIAIKDADARVPVHIVDARAILHLDVLYGVPLHLSLNAKNLFDYYYSEVPGNLAETRNLTLQIEGNF